MYKIFRFALWGHRGQNTFSLVFTAYKCCRSLVTSSASSSYPGIYMISLQFDSEYMTLYYSWYLSNLRSSTSRWMRHQIEPRIVSPSNKFSSRLEKKRNCSWHLYKCIIVCWAGQWMLLAKILSYLGCSRRIVGHDKTHTSEVISTKVQWHHFDK
jgi:hypothetical protein